MRRAVGVRASHARYENRFCLNTYTWPTRRLSSLVHVLYSVYLTFRFELELLAFDCFLGGRRVLQESFHLAELSCH
jgi:hypothetical protein